MTFVFLEKGQNGDDRDIFNRAITVLNVPGRDSKIDRTTRQERDIRGSAIGS